MVQAGLKTLSELMKLEVEDHNKFSGLKSPSHIDSELKEINAGIF